MKLSTKSNSKSLMKQMFAYGIIFLLLFSGSLPIIAQQKISGVNTKSNKKISKKEKKKQEVERKHEQEKLNKENAVEFPDGERKGEKIIVEKSDERSSEEIMTAQSLVEGEKTNREKLREKGIRKVESEVDRSNLRQNPLAPKVSRFPFSDKNEKEITNYSPFAPQTIGLNFDTVTGPTETGAFPPDTMGAAGPTQFIVFLNGRLRSFNKTTGAADGVLNVNSDVFFNSVMTPPTATNFTTDPNIRYDRLSGRWFLNMIDVPGGAGSIANRIMLAVSDGPNITGGTIWTYYQFLGGTGLFTDYQSFGVDASALYIGANMFTTAGAFSRCDGWVIPKTPTLTGGAITVYAFTNLTSGGAGPFAPRGVDNVDPTNTGPTAVGYFIGVDVALFSLLQIRRVTNPGASGGPPTISANVPLTVPTTTSPNRVTHLGNTGGANGGLDALDDRLYAAVLRNGRLWTAHNFRTSNAGVGTTAANSRNSIRWYEIQNITATPSLVQSGTVYDTQAAIGNARQYWIPTVTVSGQGHAAIGSSTAGTPFRADAFTTGRLVGDTLGTMRNSPGSIVGYTTSTFAYNPPGDPGGAGGRRWGDYSFTSLDPLDDMTIWTIQQYNNGTNTYGTRVAQLLAPPPASIADGPDMGGLYNFATGLMNVNLNITGTSVAGSGFFDPGTDLGGGAVNFKHITASISGTNVVVNSVTYNNPTSLTLNITSTGASVSSPNLSPTSLRDLTITNPDGQQITRNGIINIIPTTAAGVNVAGRATNANGNPLRGATMNLSGSFSSESYTTKTRADGSYFFEGIPAGNDVIITPSKSGYSFEPSNRFFNLVDDLSDVDFAGTPDLAHSRTANNDFDGDGISDHAVFRPNQRVWYVLQSSDNTMKAAQFGLANDVPVAADYDGDGKTDIAMWRPANGVWYSIQSSDGVDMSRQFGTDGDQPIIGYFDNDNKADLAVYRTNTADWWIQDSSTNSTRTIKWGLATDKPVPQDYDGDGLTDIAIYRPSNGTWYVIKSSNGSHLYRQFGISEDIPVLGDYDGDGQADFTVFRPGQRVWYQSESSSSSFKALQFGLSSDLVIVGDYDGDGKSDVSLFRETDSNFYVNQSLDESFQSTRWGMNGDIPIVPPTMR